MSRGMSFGDDAAFTSQGAKFQIKVGLGETKTIRPLLTKIWDGTCVFVPHKTQQGEIKNRPLYNVPFEVRQRLLLPTQELMTRFEEDVRDVYRLVGWCYEDNKLGYYEGSFSTFQKINNIAKDIARQNAGDITQHAIRISKGPNKQDRFEPALVPMSGPKTLQEALADVWDKIQADWQECMAVTEFPSMSVAEIVAVTGGSYIDNDQMLASLTAQMAALPPKDDPFAGGPSPAANPAAGFQGGVGFQPGGQAPNPLGQAPANPWQPGS